MDLCSHKDSQPENLPLLVPVSDVDTHSFIIGYLIDLIIQPDITLLLDLLCTPQLPLYPTATMLMVRLGHIPDQVTSYYRQVSLQLLIYLVYRYSISIL